MKEHDQYSPAELDALRQTAEKSLQEAAERVYGPPQREAAPAEISFDSEFPSLTEPHLVTFLLRISRRGQTNSVRFAIDLNRLQTTEQERLLGFLARRHAGTISPYDFSWHLSWLLDVWLQQTQPQLTQAERQVKARQLFLFESRPEEQNTPNALGVSPLLACVSQRGRKRLRQLHHLNIEDLEHESVQLYGDLEQFEKIPASPDFKAKAEALTKKLINHHERVKQAGFLLGGRVGNALADHANFAIEGLLTK